MATKPLVIVESPAKAKILGRFLGNKYRVEASYGHIRDLPESASEVPKEIKEKEWGRLGVDVDQDFTPYYVVPSDKRKQVALLKTAIKEASELLLATDPDREGESISWHLTQVLKPKVPVRRIVFHEITEDAVKEALKNPAGVDENLVRAQESRRILDRLYGYTLSPVLWKKVQTGLSAGRVQSVAVRLIVEREEERRAFRTSAYWDLEARLKGEGREFVATLARLGDQRIASGKDFDPSTGALKNQNARLLDEAATNTLVETIRANVPWTVTSVEQKPGVERPAPPFTTSTLTQEASRKLGFSADRTMQVAQRLFQGVDVGNDQMEGLITYHRTDSTTLSDKAINESARVIGEMFGAEYYDGARRYQTKVKNAQEAHEAIRPTDFRLAPSQLEGVLDADAFKIYDLVWKRTMASQMVDARVLRTSLEISAKAPNGETAVLTASGKAIEFAGFRRAYVEGSDDPVAELEEQEAILPQCQVGDRIHHDGSTAITLLDTEPKRHETAPPARFTEAALIKELERLGIGRPSTYAPTIATIVRRGYVMRQGKALVPSFTAFAVTKLLREHFGDFVETDFTAEMEDDLDEISRGEREWIAFLRQFYYGDRKHRGLLPAVEKGAEKADYPVLDLGTDPESGEPVRVRIGRFGPFVQVGEGGPGRTASLPEDVAPADFQVGTALELVRAKAEGPRSLGADPATGQNVYVMNGRYGAYVQLGETPEPPPKTKGKRAPVEKPKRASLQAGMTDSTVTLEEALKLLSLPRVVGLHPDNNEPITTNFGRFGPYVKHGDDFRSLESEDDVFNISFDAALALLRAPKQSRRRQPAQKKVLRELTENGSTIKLLSGRYGPYVTDGTTNASIPRNTSPEALTFAQAQELLAARRDAPPSPRRMGGRRAAAAAKSTGRTRSARRKAAGA
ncbi:MAG TPA: type I DNA topoisomerase [Vicinamibacterales bacterium]|jgi:DNA topoisomerase-1